MTYNGLHAGLLDLSLHRQADSYLDSYFGIDASHCAQ